ncbi:MAG: formyltetrahydrofolate deformylase [Afipia sp.]|nr:formyltetrahydrofolate deformylase [Afipia sp.]OJW61385.1 MAG: formyltetrahydrofolate deformylase [Afipia sp. 64-13]
MTNKNWVLTLHCQDQPRIVATVTTAIADVRGNIQESNQFWDKSTNRFFMRIAFEAPFEVTRKTLEAALDPAFKRFDMNAMLTDANTLPRIIIMVSKFDHCLNQLLYQIQLGWLKAEVVAVVSNHADAKAISERINAPFYHWPVSKENKAEQEKKLYDLYLEKRADLVILARYMQILSNDLAGKLFGHVINIHHSFLPSFKGAKPYHQAHERGVKIIGATAHYATPDLDEGPIIEQETERVSHALSADDFVAVGRDTESRVLARAVKNHLERRVLINGRKTVVFSS